MNFTDKITMAERILKELETSLTCYICYNNVTTTMLLPRCGHYYCSLCIRKVLLFQDKCPSCQMEIAENELVPLKLLDRISLKVASLRKILCEQKEDVAISSKLDIIGEPAEPSASASFVHSVVSISDKSPRAFRMESRKNVKCGTNDRCTNAGPSKTCDDGLDGEIDTDVLEIKVDKVSCPVCNQMISEKLVNQHLDQCLNASDKIEALRRRNNLQKKKLMPKLVYNLMKDAELRKKVVELGFASTGTRQDWIFRHKEYTTIYNSEIDAARPLSKLDIIKKIEKEEKIRRSQASSLFKASGVNRNSKKEDIDRINKQYVKQHKNHFKTLIGIARRQQQASSAATVVISKEKDASRAYGGDEGMSTVTVSKRCLSKVPNCDTVSAFKSHPTSNSKLKFPLTSPSLQAIPAVACSSNRRLFDCDNVTSPNSPPASTALPQLDSPLAKKLPEKPMSTVKLVQPMQKIIYSDSDSESDLFLHRKPERTSDSSVDSPVKQRPQVEHAECLPAKNETCKFVGQLSNQESAVNRSSSQMPATSLLDKELTSKKKPSLSDDDSDATFVSRRSSQSPLESEDEDDFIPPTTQEMDVSDSSSDFIPASQSFLQSQQSSSDLSDNHSDLLLCGTKKRRNSKRKSVDQRAPLLGKEGAAASHRHKEQSSTMLHDDKNMKTRKRARKMMESHIDLNNIVDVENHRRNRKRNTSL